MNLFQYLDLKLFGQLTTISWCYRGVGVKSQGFYFVVDLRQD